MLPLITLFDGFTVETNGNFSTSVVFEVLLSEAAVGDVFIPFQTVQGTAIEGVDYTAASGTLVIADGEDRGTISVTVSGGSELEADESFVLELTNPFGAEFADGLTSLRGVGTILDNDGTGPDLALFVDDLRIVEGDDGSREAVFLVRLSQAPASTLTLDFATSDGSARAGEDYVATAGTLSFTPGGSLVQEVRVDILGDLDVETSQTFSLTVAPSGALASGVAGLSGTATILDDDAGTATVPVLSIVAAEVVETDGNFSRLLEFVVTLSEPSAEEVRFGFQTIAGTADEAVDYTQSSGEGVILAGATSGIIQITTAGGNADERDESLVLELTNISGAVFAGGAPRLSATGVILDNDGSGSNLALLVGDAVLVEGGAGSREAIFEVRLSRPTTEAITLSYTTADGSARAGEDYAAAAGSLTFAAGETVKAVAIEVFGDGAVEGTERFSLVVTPTSAIANGAAGAVGEAEILDDDAGSGVLPVLSVAPATIVETDGNFSRTLEFVVTLSAPAVTDVSFGVQTIGGTADEGIDFSQTLGGGFIPAGTTSEIIQITSFGGNLSEPDETLAIELSNLQGAVFAGDAQVLRTTGTIRDNDDNGPDLALSVSDVELVEGDTGQREAVFEVRLSRPVDETVEVVYSTQPGTAATGSDFEGQHGTLIFLPGQTLAAVHVPVFGDTATEVSETFALVLSAPAGPAFGSGGAGARGLATILDDDASTAGQPVISILPTELVETDGNFSRTAEFILRLSAPSTETVSVDFATQDGSAIAGQDYTARTGSVTFAPGQTSAIVTVTTAGGNVAEPDETFTLELFNPVGAELAGGAATLAGTATIRDNDSPAPIDGLPILTVADIAVNEEDGQAVFTLQLSSPSAVDVGGDFLIGEGTASTGSDFAPASGTFSITAGETSTTLAVTLTDDLIPETDETIILTLSNLQNAQTVNQEPNLFAIAKVGDDDPANAAPVASDDAFATNEDTVLTVAAPGVLGNDTDDDGDALAVVAIENRALSIGQPFALASGALVTLNADGSFDYDPNGQFEDLDTGDLFLDGFRYTISDGQGGRAEAQAEIAVAGDSDAPELPLITLFDGFTVETNGNFSTSVVFEVLLSEAAVGDVFIPFQTVQGTAIEGVDYTAASGTLVIADGEDRGTISVTVSGGSELEADESFVLELTNPFGAEFADGLTSLRGVGTILDNDGTGPDLALFVDDLRIVEGDDGSREAVFLVRLSQAPASTLTLDFATSDGSARAGEDYVATAGTLSFTPGGSLVQEVRVDILGDLDVETSQTFSLTVAPSGALASGVAGLSGTATILDDDAGTATVPVLSIVAAEVVETDGNFSRLLEFVVTLSEPSAEEVRFGFQTIAGTADEAVDYTQSSGEGVILAGATSGIIQITTAGGNADERDESLVLELTNISGAVFAGGAPRLSATGVILDNDGSGSNLALLVGDAVLVEGGAGSREAIFEVRLSRPTTEAITLSYTTADGSARAGEDYAAAAGSLTFAAGETVKAVAIEVFGDGAVEGTERFSLVVTPTSAIANGAAGAVGEAEILDDDAGSGVLPVLSVAPATIVETDGNFSRTLEFVVTLSAPAVTDVSFGVQTIGGTADEGIDFSQTLGGGFIPAGTTSEIIQITSFGGNLSEPDETLAIELSNLQGAVFAGDAQVLRTTGTIRDNDDNGPDLALSVSDVELVEGDTGQREAVFEVRLSRPVDETVEVVYSTQPGTAATGSDFEGQHGTLIFLPGQTLAAVHVPVFGDTATEVSETFALVLSAPAGPAFGSGGAGARGLATILDDDASTAGQPVISILPTELVETDGNFSRTAEFILRLSAPSTETVSVDFATQDGSAIAGQDYTARTGSVTFAPGQTSAIVTVTTAGGNVAEPDETFTLELFNPVGAELAGGAATLAGTATIRDNDSPAPIDGLPILTVADIAVNEEDGQAVFTLQLSSPSAVDVGGDFLIGEGTASTGSDFAPASGTFSITAGETSTTLAVTLTDDLIPETDETIILTLSNLQNAQTVNQEPNLFAIAKVGDDDPANAAPVASDDAFATNEDTVLTVAAPGVLGNDTDDDGDALAVVAIENRALSIGQPFALASGALVTLNADGSFDYDPNGQFEDLDTGDLFLDGFRYTISDGQGGRAEAQAEIAVAGDSDAPELPLITLFDGFTVETNGNFSTSVVFEVLLSEAAVGDVFIPFQTVQGTAIEGVDYTAASGTLVIADGEDRGTISVTVSGGSELEADESFVLELTNPFGAEFADGLTSLRGVGTILDNDGTGPDLALFVDDLRIVEGDDGSREAVFLVRLSQAPASTLTLDFATSDGSARAGEDYVATAGTLSFTPGGSLVQEVRVDILGDLDVETSQTFSLTVAPSGALASGVAGLSGTATILDDDAGTATVPVLSIVAAEVVETDGNFSRLLEFVVTLSEPSAEEVRFGFQTIAGTADEAVDYTQSSGEGVILAGATSGIIQITTAGGNADERDESLVLELTNISGAVFAGGAPRLSATGVILDNDGSGSNLALLVGDAVLVEGGAGSREAIFEVRLSRPTTEAITLSYTTADGSARAGEDYAAAAGSLTFAAGETVKAVAIEVFGDGAVEGTERFSLVVTPTSAIANGAAGAVGEAEILDDDAGSGVLPVLSVAPATIVETDGNFSRTLEFVVTLSAPAVTDVSFGVQTIGGTADEGIDFSQTLGGGFIPAGTTSEIIQITSFGGNLSEPDETLAIELSNLQGAVFAGDAQVLRTTGTIRDNDDNGPDLALSVSDVELVEGDTGQREAVFEVRLSRPVDETVEVVYSTQPGTAATGSDFEGQHGTLIFLPGQTLAAVHVPVFGDTATEVSETFALVLSAPAGPAFGSGGAGARGLATILDDDASTAGQPVISILPTELVETDGNFSRTAEFILRLSAPSTETVSVDFATQDGSAIAGQDYTARTGSVTFAPGQTSAIVTVTTAGGNVAEPDETFTLELFNPVGAELAGGAATLAGTATIRDNDSPAPIDGLPILTVADIAVNEEDGQAVFTLQLSSPSAVDVGGDFLIGEGTASTGSDFAPASGTFSITAGETSTTLAVTLTDDLIPETDETIILTLSNLQNAQTVNQEPNLFAIAKVISPPEIAPQAFELTEGRNPALQVIALDAPGEPISFSIVPESPDGELFEITSNGALRFGSSISPGFLAPVDEDGDNVYELIIAASDQGGASNAEIVTVEILDVPNGDAVLGTDMDDVLFGGAGSDTVAGETGNDFVDLGLGDDTGDGGAGEDTLSFASLDAPGFVFGDIEFGVIVDLSAQGAAQNTGQGNDIFTNFENLEGSEFADFITGDGAANRLTGLDGGDVLNGGDGDDVLLGGEDFDTLEGGAGGDTLNGGAGLDTASYEDSDAAVIVAVNGAFAIGGDAQGDTLTSIENLLGSSFADFLRGDGQANVLTGGAGADYIQGRGGDDTLNGGENDDLLEPGAGADTVDGGEGQDLLSALDATGPVTINLGNVALSSAGYADKTLISIEGVLGVAGFGNTLVGGGGEDLLIGGDVADSISGAGGADILLGLDGADTIDGGEGDDLILGLAGDDVLSGGLGRDLFLFEPGDGADVVTDFELPVGGAAFGDRLFFSGLGLSFADLDIAEIGGDVVIGYGTDPLAFDASVTVEGVTLAELVPGGAQPDWILVF